MPGMSKGKGSKESRQRSGTRRSGAGRGAKGLHGLDHAGKSLGIGREVSGAPQRLRVHDF